MVFLTPQPFLLKLRLSKHMQAKSHGIRILALLLGVFFLGAQFHFCTDLRPRRPPRTFARFARQRPP